MKVLEIIFAPVVLAAMLFSIAAEFIWRLIWEKGND